MVDSLPLIKYNILSLINSGYNMTTFLVIALSIMVLYFGYFTYEVVVLSVKRGFRLFKLPFYKQVWIIVPISQYLIRPEDENMMGHNNQDYEEGVQTNKGAETIVPDLIKELINRKRYDLVGQIIDEMNSAVH